MTQYIYTLPGLNQFRTKHPTLQ